MLAKDWHVVARTEQLTQHPLGVRLLNEDIVLWRTAKGISAFADLCIHRGARLSLGRVQSNLLVCPYHGWHYESGGRCVRIPAQPNLAPPTKAKAKVYQAQEKYGWIWVALEAPEHDIPPFPEWDDDSFRKVHVGPYSFQASGPRVIENFLDASHFPFVHEGYLGDPEHPEIDEYDAKIGPDGVTATNISIWQPDPDGTGEARRVVYTYRVIRPLTATLVKVSSGARFAMFFSVTPVTEKSSIAWGSVAMDYSALTEAQIASFQDTITRQDIAVVESQRPELLPLDLTEELHLRSDRASMAYRKWLRQLGMDFGTS